MAFTLPKSRRLRHRPQFLAVKEQGDRLPSGTLVLNWRRLPPDQPWQVGIITTKGIGSAVIRNRARRWIREAFRRIQGRLLYPVHLVWIARPSIAKACYLWVERDLIRALTRAGLLAAAPPAAPAPPALPALPA
jgi:ribonuclease P protein component